MSTTATPIVKRYCKRKQVMCEYANELGYCKVTACVYLNQDTKTIKADGHGFWVEDSRNKLTDLIGRADAIEEISKGVWNVHELIDRIKSLPSADVVSREDYHNLLMASNDIDRALREYQANEETLKTQLANCHKEILRLLDFNNITESQNDVIDSKNDVIESADRPHGEWIFRTDIPIGNGRSSAGYVCSICGKDYFHVDMLDYCPNCGAYMNTPKGFVADEWYREEFGEDGI